MHVAAEAVRIGGHPAHVFQNVVIVDFFTVDVGGGSLGHAIAGVLAQGAVFVSGASVALSVTQAAATATSEA